MQLAQRAELHAMPATNRNGLPGDPDTVRGMTRGGAGGVEKDGPPEHTSPKFDAKVPSGQSAAAGDASARDPRPTTTTLPPTRSCRPISQR